MSLTTQQQAALSALEAFGITDFEIRNDDTIFVPGDLNLSGRELTQLPDLSCVAVGGSFYCYDNELTSIIGAPMAVGGNFRCDSNKLTSLAGAPPSLDGAFYCHNNRLLSLAGAPANCGQGFFCDYNQLTSLEGAPATVGGTFCCSNNQLGTLAGAPAEMAGDFICDDNPLTNLEHAPLKFAKLVCNAGTFKNLFELPEELMPQKIRQQLLADAAQRATTVPQAAVGRILQVPRLRIPARR